MKRSKKWISMILSAAMVVTLLPINSFAAGETATLPENAKYTGYFSYPSFGNKDFDVPFYYDDDYFTTSAYEYQDSLATMTLCMAQSAFGSTKSMNDEEGYKTKSQNLEKLLKDCGFPEENYDTNDAFKEKPTMDSIGVGASYKMITDDEKPYTLIAAAVRGGGYESEWASNFTLGKSGQHKGFSEAKDQVLSYLSEYIEDKGITGDVKLWITGYSRAAATTNLVAGAIDSGYVLSDDISLDTDDLYAYCFECPQGAAFEDDVDADVYKNIFNILNPGDVVTKIAPTKPDKFGFQRFGVNQYLPTALKEGEAYNDLQAAMLKCYDALPSTDGYAVDDFQMKKLVLANLFKDPDNIVVDDTDSKLDMNAFLDDALYKFFNNNVRSRGLYVTFYEDDMRELCHALFGCGDKWDVFEDYFIENVKEQSGEIVKCLILHRNRKLERIFEKALEDALSEAGITDYSAKQIKAFAAKFVALILPFGVSNPSYTATLIENLLPIGSAHIPEVCLAWLQSFDPNYTPGATSVFNSGVHRIVRVNGPVTLDVYNFDNDLVASVSDNTAADINGSSIVSYINEEGEKLVYLPAEEGYIVNLTPSGEGTASYSVQEYSEEAGGVDKITGYYDLDVDPDSSYTGYVPGINQPSLLSENGSTADYALTTADGTSLNADEALSGETALKANCEITATTSDENAGVVSGTTIARVGEQAKLTAVPNDNYKFTGWYEGNILVSEDMEYSFRVSGDVVIEAHFDAVTDDNEVPDDNEESSDNDEIASPDNNSNNDTEITVPDNSEDDSIIVNPAPDTDNDTENVPVIKPVVKPDYSVVSHIRHIVDNVRNSIKNFWGNLF